MSLSANNADHRILSDTGETEAVSGAEIGAGIGAVAEIDAILDRNAVDPASRRAEYAAAGWSAFDPNGPILTKEDIERERKAAHRQPLY